MAAQVNVALENVSYYKDAVMNDAKIIDFNEHHEQEPQSEQFQRSEAYSEELIAAIQNLIERLRDYKPIERATG